MIVLFISGAEIFVILVVVVLLFGAKRIPELARGFGKGMAEFRKATADIKREINQSDGGTLKDIKDVQKNIENTTKSIKNKIIESDIGKEVSSLKKDINDLKKL